MSGFTKEIIAKTFTEILDEKPMSKVTVTQEFCKNYDCRYNTCQWF